MILGAISHAIYILVCEFELPSGNSGSEAIAQIL